MTAKLRSIAHRSLLLAIVLIALLAVPGKVTALGTSEIILYVHAAGSCNSGGIGLYLINSEPNLATWPGGWNDFASAYKQTGSWTLHQDDNYGGGSFDTPLSYDCTLVGNYYDNGVTVNDSITSVSEF